MLIARRQVLASVLLISLAVSAGVSLASGQERPQRNAPSGQGEAGVLRLLPADSVTQHSIETVDGKLDYTATVGTLPIFDQGGERKASIVYVAYAARNGDSANRPVTFVFNGGPGAASTYLHLGLVGPRRIDFGASGRNGATPHLRDNKETWLAFTDLVMIDPIGTGWSRTAKPDDASKFWNVRADAQVIAKVIALYVARNGRSSSPKYLLGESYGGYRAAKVAHTLQEEQNIIASGILMVSPLIEGGLHFAGGRYALGCALKLPSVIAAELEWRHAFSEKALAEGEHFALGEYLTTLAGPPPKGEAARAFYSRIAEMTGLSPERVAKANGCVSDEYLRYRRADVGETLSAYDATFAAPDPFPESPRRGPDPVLDGFTRALGSAFVSYARDELGFKTDITYNLLASEIAGKWEWPRGSRATAGVSDDLRELLALNASFKLLVGHGYSDLVVPYAANRYALERLPQWDEAERVVFKGYRGGHMFYLNDASRVAFTEQARALYNGKR
jgi:carboxypeptidase C (cathepsin A)